MSDQPGIPNRSANHKQMISTGVAGLDDVMRGGFPRNRLFLIEGAPGTGKTTIGIQFLLDGVRKGEKTLYVTLSETAEELRDVAASHGWSLDGIELYELEALGDRLHPEEQYTVFHPEEVELTETTARIYKVVESLRPSRVVFDSLSEMRLLAHDALRFRRQVLALKQFFVGKNCTVVLLDDRTSAGSDLQLQSICHGVLLLQKIPADFGKPRRKISVSKMRGVDFRDGDHDIAILEGGIVVYPRLVAAEHRVAGPLSEVSSGLEQLDALLGGGLDRGTSTLILGPAGTGKSTLAALFACTAAQRGEHSAFYLFEESLNTFLKRCTGMGMPLDRFIEEGLVTVQQIDPAELSPGEFAALVRKSVDQDEARIVVIDSLNGYLNAMPSDQLLLLQMHELLTYLGQRQVLTIMCVAQQGLMGQMQSPVDLSYLADSVILLRFFELGGTIHQAVSVLKKRSGSHERTIRQLRLTPSGPTVSDVLKDLHGIFTGVPHMEPDANTRPPVFGVEQR